MTSKVVTIQHFDCIMIEWVSGLLVIVPSGRSHSLLGTIARTVNYHLQYILFLHKFELFYKITCVILSDSLSVIN
jgi:hypothetical protein